MQLPILANDVCRCHDAECRERHSCLRWLARETGGDRTPHVASMIPDGSQIGTQCPSKIHVEVGDDS